MRPESRYGISSVPAIEEALTLFSSRVVDAAISPTPAAAAVTASAVSGHARVAYLTGDGVGSSPELAVDDDPRAHARAGLEADEIAHGLRVAEPRLGNRLDAALVVEVDRQAEFILEQRRESDAAPARHVRDRDHATDLVHQSRHAHPECHYRAARLVPGHERAQQVDQRVDRALRVGERVERTRRPDGVPPPRRSRRYLRPAGRP